MLRTPVGSPGTSRPGTSRPGTSRPGTSRPGTSRPGTSGTGRPRPRLHYAWVVFGVTFLTLLAAAGFRSTPGVLIDPLQDEFGWTKATIGGAASVNLLLFGLIGPFAAALMARYGLRRVVVAALGTISVGALAATQMDAAWQLVLLWGVVVGIGSGCMAAVFAATVANRWFVARRGLVMGALTAASASGQLVFLPLLSYLASNVGWRWVSVTIAVSALAATPLVLVGLRDRPEDVGLRPYGADDTYEAPLAVSDPVRTALAGLRDAWRSGAFWLLVGSFWVCGLSTNGLIQAHFIPAAEDHGIPATSAATLLALVGVFDVAGTLGSGWLTDRYDPRKLLVAYYGLRGLSLLVLHPALEARGFGLGGFMVFYGLDWVATVPPTVALCTQVFGRERAPVVFGWVFAAHQLGAAAAAWGAGRTRDVLGSYQPAFLVAGGAYLLAAVAVRYIRPPAERHRGALAVSAQPAPTNLTTLRTGSNTPCDLRAQALGRHDAWLADRQIRTSGDPPAQAQPDRNLRGVLPGHGHTPSVRFTPNCRGRHPTVQLSGRRVNGLRTRPEEEGTCRDHLVSTNCRGATGPSAGPGSSTTSRCWTT